MNKQAILKKAREEMFPRTGGDTTMVISIYKLEQILTAQEGESEYMSGYADGVTSVNAKEIAKRIIEEYHETFKIPDPVSEAEYTYPVEVVIKSIIDWLDKDGE